MAPELRHRDGRREASTSSIDEDQKISGSWLGGEQSPSASSATSTRESSKKGAKKVERIERIGLLSGSANADAHGSDEAGELTSVIGIQDDELYDKYLPWPIARIRSALVSVLRREGPYHARHQTFIRRPWLDRYFVNTSLLGTHSFFLIFLPMVFWLGDHRFGRGLVNVLAFGVYLSSALKDLFCVPRPYSPPVTRLTIGTHHLEYGFPSTHSTNSVSIAAYLYMWVLLFRQNPEAATELGVHAVFANRLWEAGLLFYSFSVVYGRIYAGMHSMIDCIVGSLLGASISWVQMRSFDAMEAFLAMEGWTVPLVIVPAGLLMVSVHPQPMEDCPCFEDAIAFIAVAMGTSLGRWLSVSHGFEPIDSDPLKPRTSKVLLTAQGLLVPGSKVAELVEPVLDAIRQPVEALSRDHQHAGIQLLKALIAVVFGVVNILLLRVVVKTMCKLVLPPIFRFVDESIGFTLPRRHYTPASDYQSIPITDLSAVPSVIDLPSTIIVTDENGRQTGVDEGAGAGLRNRGGLRPSSPGSPLLRTSFQSSPVPSRTPSPGPGPLPPTQTRQKRIQFDIGGGSEDEPGPLPIPLTQSHAHPDFVGPDEKVARKIAGNVKHYDADVLTKVIVYASIGFAASCVIPAFLERLGLVSSS